MADIELVIKIPEEMYKWVNDANKFFNDYGISDFIDLVKNGIPLPKGHGRLVDADALVDTLGASDRDIYCEAVIEEDAPTIIEADGSEE